MTAADTLLTRYPVISDQVSREDIRVVLTELETVLARQVPGEVVELGCYIGTTSLFIRRLLDARHEARTFHAYDSFAGLPPKSRQDMSPAGEGFKAGELTVSKSQFLREFRRSGLKPPIIHKHWFEELTATDLPEHIAFAFLDGDFYQSILTSLRLVWPRMSDGGIILVDDYGREALPGVERAVQAFFQGKPRPTMRVTHDIAVITRK